MSWVLLKKELCWGFEGEEQKLKAEGCQELAIELLLFRCSWIFSIHGQHLLELLWQLLLCLASGCVWLKHRSRSSPDLLPGDPGLEPTRVLKYLRSIQASWSLIKCTQWFSSPSCCSVVLSFSPAIPSMCQDDSDGLMLPLGTVHFRGLHRLCVLCTTVINPRSCHMERVNEAYKNTTLLLQFWLFSWLFL